MPQTVTLNIDLNAPVTWDGFQAALLAFLRWWGSQLIEILPASWKHALQSSMAIPTLDVREPLWKLALVDRDASVATLESSRDDDELRQHIKRLFPEEVSNGIVVILSPDDALLRRIVVPAAAAKRLHSVVQLQIDRLSPFRGDDVLFDCRLAEPSEAAATELAVDVALIPKATLVALERRIRQMGLVPRIFKIGDTGLAVNATGVPWTRRRLRQIAVVAAACVVWAAVFWLAPITRDQEIQSLQTEISSLAPQVSQAERFRAMLGHYDVPPSARSADRARALDVLLALTRGLPDEVYVTSLTLADDTLTLRGSAPATVEVRPLLMRIGLFDKSRIAGRQTGGTFAYALALRSAPGPRGSPR